MMDMMIVYHLPTDSKEKQRDANKEISLSLSYQKLKLCKDNFPMIQLKDGKSDVLVEMFPWQLKYQEGVTEPA